MSRRLRLTSERLSPLSGAELHAVVAGAPLPTNPCPLLTSGCPATLDGCLTGR